VSKQRRDENTFGNIPEIVCAIIFQAIISMIFAKLQKCRILLTLLGVIRRFNAFSNNCRENWLSLPGELALFSGRIGSLL
jgi:hypothetical protein